MRIAPEIDSNNQLSDSYRIRFRATSRKERQAARNLFEIESELSNAGLDNSLSDSLHNRYQNIIELAQQEVSLSLVSQQLSLEKSLFESETIATTNSSRQEANLQNAVIEIEQLNRQYESELRRAIDLRAATIANHLQAEKSAPAKVSLQLIQPQQLKTRLAEIAAQTTSHSISSRATTLAALEVERAKEALALEKGRTGFGLNLLELRYNNNIDTDSYMLNFGFRLPFLQPRIAATKRTRELLVAEREKSLTQQMQSEVIDSAVRAISWQIDSYLANEDALLSLTKQMQSSVDLDNLAVLHRYRLKLLNNAASTHINILYDYIDLLNILGILQKKPQINWLAGA